MNNIRRYGIKVIILTVIIIWGSINMGAFTLPADAFIDTYQVQVDVNLHSIEYFSKEANTSDEELTKYHEAIIDIADKHSSKGEIKEMDELFNKFLEDRSEQSLKVYTDTVTKSINGKPNYILFGIVIVLVIGAIAISIRKIK